MNKYELINNYNLYGQRGAKGAKSIPRHHACSMLDGCAACPVCTCMWVSGLEVHS